MSILFLERVVFDRTIAVEALLRLCQTQKNRNQDHPNATHKLRAEKYGWRSEKYFQAPGKLLTKLAQGTN